MFLLTKHHDFHQLQFIYIFPAHTYIVFPYLALIAYLCYSSLSYLLHCFGVKQLQFH